MNTVLGPLGAITRIKDAGIAICHPQGCIVPPVAYHRICPQSMCPPALVNLHQRCGYSDLPFLIICCYTSESRNGVEGVNMVVTQTRCLQSNKLFHLQKTARLISWDQKCALDLLVSTMKPSCLENG